MEGTSIACLQTTLGETTAERARPGPREAWVDVSKGVAICLVVLGHIVGGLLASGLLRPSGVGPFVYSWIYMFHMPAFMFLSGLFLAKAADRGLAHFILDRLGTLYYPSIVWAVITFAVALAFRRYMNTAPNVSSLICVLYHPKLSSYWFLTTLLELSVGFAVLRKLRIPPTAMLAVAIAAGIVAFRSNHAVVFHCAWYASFLLAAVLLREKLARAVKSTPNYILIVSAVVGFATLTLLAPPRLPAVPTARQFFASVAGMLMLFALAVNLARHSARAASVLSFLGRHSLEIYLAHGLVVPAVRVFFIRAHLPIPGVIIPFALAVGLAGPAILAWFSERSGWSMLFRMRFARPQ